MNDPVKVLMEMTDEMVYAKDIAPILKMPADRIVFYAKNGKWDTEKWGNFIISGDDPKTSHVKFFRKDFLQKCGFMEPEKEEQVDEKQEARDMVQLKQLEGMQLICKTLIGLGNTLHLILNMLDCMMTPEQRLIYEIRYADNKKTAGAGTPTE